MANGVFNYKLTVLESHIDTNQHVNNVNYVLWMQNAAVEHSNTLGLDIDFYTKSGKYWVARSHFIEYLLPAFLNDEIVVQTWVTQIKKASCHRSYAFIRVSDKALIARANTLWIYIDQESSKPTKLPKELLDKYIANEDYKPSLD